MAENAVVKKSYVRLIIGLIILLLGIIVLVAGIVMWRVGGVDKYVKLESFTIKDQPLDGVTKLEIGIDSADVVIKRGGDKLQVEALNVLEGSYDHGVRDGEFVLKSKNRSWMSVLSNPWVLRWFMSDEFEPKINITLPEKMFDEVELAVGTGKTTVEGIEARDVEIDIGTGEFIAKDFKVTGKLDIDHGTGAATFENFDTHKVEIDSGIGELNFTGTVGGGLEANCGIGEVNITIYGSSSDYDIDAESGIGSVSIDKDGGSGHGNIPIEIEGGIGEVNLKFKNKE